MAQSKLPEEIYSEIENLAYEAAVIPKQWPKLLQLLSDAGGRLGAVMFSANE